MRPLRTVRILCASLLGLCLGVLLPLHHHHDHGDVVAAGAEAAHAHEGHDHDAHDHADHGHDHAPAESDHADCPVCELARTLTLQAYLLPPVAGPKVVERQRPPRLAAPEFPQVIRVYDGRGPPAC